MPYFVYRMLPFSRLEPLGQYDSFPEASREAKALRASDPGGQRRRVRVVFADHALAAEDLLLQVREAPPGGDDD